MTKREKKIKSLKMLADACGNASIKILIGSIGTLVVGGCFALAADILARKKENNQ